MRQLPRAGRRDLSRGLPSAARAALAGLIGLALAAPATASADLSGEWKHKRTKLTFKVTAWGEECGPRPQTTNRKERGKVVVTEAGGKIEFKKRRWKFGTHRCLSQNPELKFKGYSAGTRTTKCATPASSSKGESGSYTLKTPDDNTIRYEGSTIYDWSLKGVSCKATMKEVQLFARPPPAAPAPVAEPTPPSAPEPEPPPAPEPVVAQQDVVEEVVDAVTGKVTRRRKKKGGGYVLDLEGSAGRGGAGGLGGLADERHQVGTASARRGTGLALGIILATVAISLFAGAFLLVSRRRKRGRGGPTGSAGGGGASYGGGGRDGGGAAGDGLRASSAVARPRPPPDSRTQGAGRSAAQIASQPPRGPGVMTGAPPPPPVSQSGAGARMMCPKCSRDYDPAERFCPYDASKLQRASAAAPGAEFVLSPRLICRTCLREFPVELAAGATRCPDDGDQLLPLVGAETRDADLGAGLPAADDADPQAQPGPDKICPSCSVRYPAAVVFCGKDGAELVQIN